MSLKGRALRLGAPLVLGLARRQLAKRYFDDPGPRRRNGNGKEDNGMNLPKDKLRSLLDEAGVDSDAIERRVKTAAERGRQAALTRLDAVQLSADERDFLGRWWDCYRARAVATGDQPDDSQYKLARKLGLWP